MAQVIWRSQLQQNFYDILNISQDSSKQVIREAYLRLKNSQQMYADRELPKDWNGQPLVVENVKLEEAFSILHDDEKRILYDHDILKIKKENLQYFENPSRESVKTFRSTLKIHPTYAPQSLREEAQTKYLEIQTSCDLGSGDTLVKLRAAATVSRNEIIERTKISMEYLLAIESNQFEKMPQFVYVRGFIRSYLKYLRVPSIESYVEAYTKRYEDWRLTQVK